MSVQAAVALQPDPQPPPPSADQPKGHPRGLYFLFGTEMWERFSYYGMRALLVLYLITYLQWQPSDASSVYKWYTSLVYLAPLLGGFLADRFLGLRASIVIGGTLMAIGHFLMAFEPLPFLYAALGFLVAGNGFFKPNISTMVGKMYRQGDSRRDGAFTIFYMGINLGAFLSPLVCGALRQHFGFHYGFAAAGVGMCIGLVIFLVGQKRVMADVAAAGNSAAAGTPGAKAANLGADVSESQAGAGGLSGLLSRVFPYLLLALAVAVPAWYLWLAARGQEKWLNVIMPTAFALIGGWMGVTLLTIKGAARNKSTVIFMLFAFAVLFWMAFEQAGNALNIWAEFNTVQHVGPVETTAEYYQSVNAVLIVALAPLFAIMWVAFARRKKEIPTAVKMFVAMVFMALSFGAMVAGAIAEDRTVTRVPVAGVPAQLKLEKATPDEVKNQGGELMTVLVPDDSGSGLKKVHAGRMLYDASAKELVVRGALPPFAVMDALRPTVDPAYLASIDALDKSAQYASKEKPVTAKIGPLAAGFVLPKLDSVSAFDAATGQATLIDSVNAVGKAKLIGAGAALEWRTALDDAAHRSEAARVGGFWLLLSYFLATLGELCLSPVGLSMVTKLAPARFASLFMGVWLLASSVAQYLGGSLGEMWGQVAPTNYFMIFVWTSLLGAAALAPLIIPLRRLMHEVK